MSWISLTATLIMFITWMFTMHKWKEVKRESDAKDLTIATLRDNRSFWKEEARKCQRDLGYRTDTIGKYIVEVNEGTYLVKKYINDYRNTCIITDNIFEALSYDDLDSAKENARSFNGRVLEHKPNLEVVE